MAIISILHYVPISLYIIIVGIDSIIGDNTYIRRGINYLAFIKLIYKWLRNDALLIYVTDLVLSVLRLLREDIQEVVDSMEPVKPWDEG